MKTLSDLLPLAWFGLIVIGVISSVVKSARRQAAKTATAQQPEVRVAGVPQGLHAQFAANAAQLAPKPATPPAPATVPRAVTPLAVRRAVPAPRPAPSPGAMPDTLADYTPPPTSYVPAPLDNAPPPHAMVLQQRSVRAARLFGTSHAILRSIIASEVLGKPRALRDEY